jgi:hypothetical protein
MARLRDRLPHGEPAAQSTVSAQSSHGQADGPAIQTERPASVHVNQQVHFDLLPIDSRRPARGGFFVVSRTEKRKQMSVSAAFRYNKLDSPSAIGK